MLVFLRTMMLVSRPWRARFMKAVGGEEGLVQKGDEEKEEE